MTGMVEVEIGATFEVLCEARGVPPPIISWTHNGKSISEPYKHKPRHLFHVTNISMSGLIDCVANNGVGEPASTGIFLVVLCKFETFTCKKIIMITSCPLL